MSDPSENAMPELKAEDYRSPSSQTKPVGRTPAQRKIDAEILRSNWLLFIGGICFLSIACFVMFAGQMDTKDRIDTLLKFILPVAGSMIGFSAGGRK